MSVIIISRERLYNILVNVLEDEIGGTSVPGIASRICDDAARPLRSSDFPEGSNARAVLAAIEAREAKR